MKIILAISSLFVCLYAADLSRLSAEQKIIFNSLDEKQKKELISSQDKMNPKEKNIRKSESSISPKAHTKKVLAVSQRYSSWLFKEGAESLFSETSNVISKDYPLKAGDELLLSLWGGPEKELSLIMNQQGAVFVDDVGWVNLSGLTLSQAKAKLKRVLGKSIVGFGLGTTKLELSVVNVTPIKVFVLGEVLNPGTYHLQGASSLFTALYKANGPNEIGSVREIHLIRNNKKRKIDLYEYLFSGRKPKNELLKDGDVIFLPVAEKIISVSGEVGRPGKYEIKVNESFNKIQKFFGNVKFSATSESGKIFRINNDGEKLIIPLDENVKADKLIDGDSIVIQRSAEVYEEIIHVSGEVLYPGIYDYKTSSTLAQAVEAAGGTREEAFTNRVMVFRKSKGLYTNIFSQELEESAEFNLSPLDSVLVLKERTLARLDSVAISGFIQSAGNYQFVEGMTLTDLILLSGGFKKGFDAGEIVIERLTAQRKIEVKKVKVDSSLSKSADEFILRKGDRVVLLKNQNFYKQELVLLEGAFLNRGMFSLKTQDEKISSFLSRVGGMQEEAYVGGAQFFRQREIREEVLNADSSVSIITKKVLKQVNIDFDKALKGDSFHDVSLRHGDKIYVPKQSISISIEGEVVDPGEVMYVVGEDADFYINGSGGLTRNADEDRIVIIYANGTKSNLSDAEKPLDPGSRIVVSYKPEDPPIDWLSGFNTTIGILGSLATIVLTVVLINSGGK